MSVAGDRVWWLYGPPSVGKSVTAWELYVHLLRGEPRGYFDIDQVGMCYPEPRDDPGRYALKARAAGALVRRLTDVGARTVIVSGVLAERSVREVVEGFNGVGVTFCRLRVEPEELRRRLETRYGAEDVVRAVAEAQEWDQRGFTHVVVDTGEGSRSTLPAGCWRLSALHHPRQRCRHLDYDRRLYPRWVPVRDVPC